MRIQFQLALRYLWGRKQRMILTTLAVVFGVAILFGMNGLMPAMIEAFRHNVVTSAGVVDITISAKSNGVFDASLLDLVGSTDGVDQYSGSLQRSVLMPESLGGKIDPLTGSSALLITGLDPQTARTVRNYPVSSGRFLEPGDSSVAVISSKMADKMNLSVGSTLRIPSSLGTADLEVIGILDSITAGADEIYVPLAKTQEILNLPGQINSIDILIKSTADAAQVSNALLAKLGDAFKSGPVQVGNELAVVMSLGGGIMTFFGVMALAMAAFIIFNTFRTVVAERRHDLGMLRALGASRKMIMGLIITESLIQGIIGTVAGLILGALLAYGLLNGMNYMIQQYLRVSISHPVFTAGNWIASILLGVGFTVGSSYFPAVSAMKVTPLEALRPSTASIEQKQYVRRAVVGVILTALSVAGLLVNDLNVSSFAALLFLVGMVLLAPVLVKPVADTFGRLLGLFFAREGNLAQGNLARQPGRAAITASAMMIGLAITIALVGMVSSIINAFYGYLDKSLGADYLVMPSSLVLGGGNLGAAPNLSREISEVKGIERVTTLRLASSTFKNQSLQLIGIDPQTYPQVAGLEFSVGDPATAFAALGSERGIIINGILSASSGIKVGDTITLKTSSGDQSYQVVGIAMDYLNAKLATGYISQQNMAADFHVTSDVLLMANHAADANTAETTAALKALVDQYPSFSMVDSVHFKESQKKTFNKAMSAIYVLVVMLAIPGLIAMTNTMSINIIERTREIGMLRAVGSTRRQVKRIVLAESLLLSALGTVLGIAVGLFMSYYMVKALRITGFTLSFYFPGVGILVGIAVGFAFGIFAALAPARRAANTQIVDALHYE